MGEKPEAGGSQHTRFSHVCLLAAVRDKGNLVFFIKNIMNDEKVKGNTVCLHVTLRRLKICIINVILRIPTSKL